MCNLGWCYESGNGVEQSWEEAFCWYRKGVEKGSTRAMFQLAWCYEKGLGVEQDPAQAADWYRRGAEAGSTACMNNLAELLAKGDGVPQDLEQAMKWYRRAAELDDECAWYNLGWYHEQAGELDQALECLLRADELGDDSACWGLGRFYETGTAVEQDLEQAFAYYRKGAEREDLNSLCRLARCYALGIGTRKDREKASALAQEILSRDWEESGELEDYGARAELEALRALWKELEPEKP